MVVVIEIVFMDALEPSKNRAACSLSSRIMYLIDITLFYFLQTNRGAMEVQHIVKYSDA